MGTWIVLALLSGDLNADQQAALTAARATPSAVHVRIDQDGGLPLTDLRTAVDEIRRIWNRAGVEVTWGRYAEAPPTPRAIVSMRIVGDHLLREAAPVLGWARPDLAEQKVPIVFISLAGVTDLLAAAAFRGLRYSAQPLALRQQLVARAVGRVAAHELGHYLLRDREHDEHGLMRPRYSPADLLAASSTPFDIPLGARSALTRQVALLTARQAPPATIARR